MDSSSFAGQAKTLLKRNVVLLVSIIVVLIVLIVGLVLVYNKVDKTEASCTSTCQNTSGGSGSPHHKKRPHTVIFHGQGGPQLAGFRSRREHWAMSGPREPSDLMERLSMGPGPAMPTTPNMSGQAPANPCGPGQTPIFSSGGDFVYCQSNGSLPEGPAMTCGKNGIGGQWAPEAMAEANALEAVGALSPSVYYGEQRLDRHIGNNPATGASGTGLTEAQLMPLLHSGGAP